MLPTDCRVNRTATILADGRILLAGGSTVEPLPPSDARYDLRFVLMPVAEVFDPVSGTASPTGPMVQPREGHTATLLADGRVVVIGGVDPDQPFASNGVGRLLSSAEIFSLD